jgi:hypothetical protein
MRLLIDTGERIILQCYILYNVRSIVHTYTASQWTARLGRPCMKNAFLRQGADVKTCQQMKNTCIPGWCKMYSGQK